MIVDNERGFAQRARRGSWRAATLIAVVLVLLAIGLPRLRLPTLSNPFSSTTVDRSAPALLTSLTDLARFEAASGSFQVVVDVEMDVAKIPSALAGERTLFLAQGSVDSSVDFAGIGKNAVTVSADGTRVDIVLPPATLSDPRVDTEQSRVYSRDRGLLNRLGGIFSDSPTSERELYLAAERKMTEAAEAGGLQNQAENNTRAMLESLLGTLGYTDVNVAFSPDLRP